MRQNLAAAIAMLGCFGCQPQALDESARPVKAGWIETVNQDGVRVTLPSVKVAPGEFDQIMRLNSKLLSNDFSKRNGVTELSTSCSLSSPVLAVNSVKGAGDTKPSCYNYATFSGDDEADCYIKFPVYRSRASYTFKTTNVCANLAWDYYSRRGGIQVLISDNGVALRMDSTWCGWPAHCEDGFELQY